MNSRTILFCCMVGLVLGPGHASGQIRMLGGAPRPATGGDVVAHLGGVYTDGKKFAFYKGTETAIMTSSGGAISVRMLGGDPLPPPLVGSFADFDNVVVNDAGDLVFIGHCNSATVDKGYFLRRANGSLVHLDAGLSASVKFPADINDSGDVVWMSRDRKLYLYDDATGVSSLIVEEGTSGAPGGAIWGRLGEHPVIGDGGEVAFIAEVDSDVGVFLYFPANGVFTTVARTGLPSPLGGGSLYSGIDRASSIAIDDSGNVAFTAQLSGPPVSAAAFLYHPSGGAVVVAEEGDAVSGAGPGVFLEELRESFVGIDDLGRVAILGDIDPTNLNDDRVLLQPAPGNGGPLVLHSPLLPSPHSFFSRLTDSTAPVPTSVVFSEGSDDVSLLVPGPASATVVDRSTPTPLGEDVVSSTPSVSHSGIVAFTSTHEKLYVDRFVAPKALSLIEVGDPSPAGGGFVTRELSAHVADRRHAAFLVEDDGPPPAPWQRSHVLTYRRLSFPAPAFTGTVAATFDPAPAGIGGTIDLESTKPLAIKGRRVYFVSSVTGGAASLALFAGRGGGTLRTVLPVGAPTPVGSFNGIADSTLVASGKFVAFNAEVGSLVFRSGLYIMKWRNAGTVRALAQEGDPLPSGAGVFDSFGALAINKKGQALFAATSDLGSVGLFLHDGTALSTVVLDGDGVPASVPGGGNLRVYPDTSLGLSKKGVPVMVLAIEGGTTWEGLFALDPTNGLVPIALAPGTMSTAGGEIVNFDYFSTESPLLVKRKKLVGTVGFTLSQRSPAIVEISF